MRKRFIPLNLNRWQLLASINFSTRNTHVGGRGLGKTTHLAKVMADVVHSMPRSANALVCRTYLQAITRTLPAIAAGLEQLGYFEGIHYVVGIKPPKSWPKPFFAPNDYSHFISWYTGAGYHIVSQERKGSSRGFNIDSWMADEGLNLKKDMIDNEISVANRANQGKFSGIKFHLSETIVSSQPVLPESKWLLERADYYKEDGHSYEDYRNTLTEILLQIVDSSKEEEINELWSEAYELKTSFKFYRHKEIIPVTNQIISSYFSDGDVFDNIMNIKWPYIKQQRASMSDLMFKVEVLNGIFTMSEHGFYPDLSDHHLYDISDYSAYENLQYNYKAVIEAGSTFDDSIDPKRELHIACDYGGSFNCMVVSQEYDNEERLIQAFHVYHPKKIEDVVAQFVKYFESHPNKKVHFYYDQTAIGTSGLVDYNYADEVERLLRLAGWNVRMHYGGAAPAHQTKYLFINKILSENNLSEFPVVRMHREHCRVLYNSMRLAAIEQGSKEFKKDKRPERKKSVDQAKAPHYSDAFDMLLYHKHSDKQKSGNSGFSSAAW